MTRLDALFDAYDRWYRTTYSRAMQDGLGGPFDAVEPVTSAALGKLARTAALPAAFRVLLARRGAGVIKAAEDWGQSEYCLLRPDQMDRARRDCISWIGADARVRVKQQQGLDVTAMVPFLVMPDQTTWVVLAGRRPIDRVFYVSHDWEQREDFELFAGPLTLVAFFDHFFARCRRKDPLNGSYEHRHRFNKHR